MLLSMKTNCFWLLVIPLSSFSGCIKIKQNLVDNYALDVMPAAYGPGASFRFGDPMGPPRFASQPVDAHRILRRHLTHELKMRR